MSKFTEHGPTELRLKLARAKEAITNNLFPGIYGPDGLAEMLDSLGEQVTENEEIQEELETKLMNLEKLLEPSFPGPDSSIEDLHDEMESWNSALEFDIDQLSSVVDMLASAVSINVKSLRSRISDLEQGLTVLYAQVQPKEIHVPSFGEITLSDLLAAEEMDASHYEALCIEAAKVILPLPRGLVNQINEDHDTALVMNQYPQTAQQFNDWVASQSSENVTFSSEA